MDTVVIHVHCWGQLRWRGDIWSHVGHYEVECETCGRIVRGYSEDAVRDRCEVLDGVAA